MRDGGFGTTLDAPPLDPETAAAVEGHAFDAVRRVHWRNTRLDLSSPLALLRGLEMPPPARELMRPRDSDDLASLRALLRLPETVARAVDYDAVSLLWQVCRIPDFRKTVPDAHHRLLAAIYRHLTDPAGVLPEAWVARLVDRLDRTDGDIDMLATRLAHVRTWNYIAWRPGWTVDPAALRARARAIEDKLSDALHERLTGRFIDRPAALLVKRMGRRAAVAAAVAKTGEVTVEGERVGRLSGLRFAPDDTESWRDVRVWRAAVRHALAPELRVRAESLAAAPDSAFALDDGGAVLWGETPVARLARGAAALRPGLRLADGDALAPAPRARVERRLAAWMEGQVAEVLEPLFRARRDSPGGLVRGLVFQVTEAGAAARREVDDAWRALGPGERKTLAALGVRVGRETAFMPALLAPRAMALRALLWCVHNDRPPAVPPPGRVSLALAGDGRTGDRLAGERPAGWCRAAGYWPVGARAVRVDMLERLSAALRRRARAGPVRIDRALCGLAGCPGADMDALLRALGWRAVDGGGGEAARYAPVRRRPAWRSSGSGGGPGGGGKAGRGAAAGAPFAALARWKAPEA